MNKTIPKTKKEDMNKTIPKKEDMDKNIPKKEVINKIKDEYIDMSWNKSIEVFRLSKVKRDKINK